MKNKVMFIEDEEVFHELIQDILAKENIQITCVSNGQQALKYPRHDLYIVDLGLPGMDGIETLKALAKKFGTRVPAFLITGYNPSIDLSGMKRYGIKHILQKPFDIDELKALIHAHFS
ncbi:MAG: response regulator [Calditrichaeota bacterium]|nr:MAG: response regulator [Calditrichota bacterium]